MIADIVHDFDWYLDHGHVYLVELELAWEDENAEPTHGFLNYDVYLIANGGNQAHYIATTLYPDALSYVYSDDPITRTDYVCRRNRSNV